MSIDYYLVSYETKEALSVGRRSANGKPYLYCTVSEKFAQRLEWFMFTHADNALHLIHDDLLNDLVCSDPDWVVHEEE